MSMNFMSVTNWFGGRSFFLTLVYLAGGMWLALHHQLTPEYLGLSAATVGIYAARSVLDDFAKKPEGGNGK